MFSLDKIQRGIYASLAKEIKVPIYFYSQGNKADTHVKIAQVKVIEGSSIGSGIAEVEVGLQIISTLKSSVEIMDIMEVVSRLYHYNKIKFEDLIVNCNKNLERSLNINTEYKWNGEITFGFYLESMN